jgi:hypothetical protein
MKKIYFVFLFCFIFCSFIHAAETPSEDSLIKAWETMQKNDPNNVTFQKIKDRHYKFSNKLFPFNGVLKIKDVTIDSAVTFGNPDNYIMGIIDVELEKMSKDFIQLHSRKYYMWARNNNLCYDKKAGKWLSTQECQAAMAKIQQKMANPSSPFFSINILIIAFLVVMAYIIYVARHYKTAVKTSLQKQAEAIAQSNRSLELSEKAIAVGKESNKILSDILNTLKNK